MSEQAGSVPWPPLWFVFCLVCLVPSAPSAAVPRPLLPRKVEVASFAFSPGDGAGCDEGRIQAAIIAAGVGGEVGFDGGQVYRLCTELRPLPGQRWVGRGSTLARMDGVVARLAADAQTGATAVELDDASRIRPGSYVTPISGPSMADGEGPHRRLRVLAVENNRRVSLGAPLGRAYRAGDRVITIASLVRAWVPVDGFSVEGLVFDGNHRGNDAYVAWQRGESLLLMGQRLAVRGCRFVDSWGDALKLFSANDVQITGNRFEGGAGAGIHLSATTRVVIEGNHFSALGQRAREAGHSDGAVTFSAKNRGTRILANRFQDLHNAAVATINLGWNGNVTIADNLSVGGSVFLAARLRGELDPAFGGEVTVVGNRLASGETIHWKVREPGPLLPRLVLADNRCERGRLVSNGPAVVDLVGNVFAVEPPVMARDSGSEGRSKRLVEASENSVEPPSPNSAGTMEEGGSAPGVGPGAEGS